MLLLLLVAFALIIAVYMALLYVVDPCSESEYIADTEDIKPENVHVFMAYDDHYKKLFAEKFANINERYCQSYGFQFHVFDDLPPVHNEKPHYLRYHALRQLSQKYGEEAVFIYLDADAVVMNHEIDIRKWIPATTDILLGNTNIMTSPFKFARFGFGLVGQTGILIVKNTLPGKNFIESVLTSDACNTTRHSPVMGNYDQSCVSILYQYGVKRLDQHMKKIPHTFPIQQTISCTQPKAAYSFHSSIPIMHFYGEKGDIGNVQLHINERIKNNKPRRTKTWNSVSYVKTARGAWSN